MRKNNQKKLSVVTSLILMCSLVTGCSNTKSRCDDLLEALSYGPWSSSDNEWFDANCS